MRLVDQFKKARQQDLDTFQADINRHNEDLVTTYKNHQSELKADFEMVTALVAKQEKKWKESQEVQQDVQSTLDAALVACMEYASHEGKAITEPDMSF